MQENVTMSGVIDLDVLVSSQIESERKALVNMPSGLAAAAFAEVVLQKDRAAHLRASLDRQMARKIEKQKSSNAAEFFDQYQAKAKKTQHADFISCFCENLDVDLLGIDNKLLEKIKKQEYDKAVELINALYSFSIDYRRLSNLFYSFEKTGKRLDFFKDLTRLLSLVRESVRNVDTFAVKNAAKDIKTLAEKAQRKSQEYVCDSILRESIEDIFFAVKNDVGNSIGRTLL